MRPAALYTVIVTAWSARRVPTPSEIAALQREMPGLEVELHAAPGTRRSELSHQDSYSYVLAQLYLGVRDPQELLEAWRRCWRELRFVVLG